MHALQVPEAAEDAEVAADADGTSEGGADMEWAPAAVDAEQEDDEATLEEEEVRLPGNRGAANALRQQKAAANALHKRQGPCMVVHRKLASSVRTTSLAAYNTLHTATGLAANISCAQLRIYPPSTGAATFMWRPSLSPFLIIHGAHGTGSGQGSGA